ncbi:MAG TPA: CoA activase, partial [Desulfobacteraceae bacterium]|nr:CoA activase [Desulfobacteraceae bacterium]
VTRLQFDNGKVFYSGNRCDRIFSNGGSSGARGFNLTRYKEKLLFDRPRKGDDRPKAVIGIPRVLNMYENFPFWCTIFVELGFEVRLSSTSSARLYEKGSGTIMSDSICFPAKMVHGHIMDLMEKGVDRIFYPIIVYEHFEQKGFNSFNCPIVTGYPLVIRSAIDPEGKKGIPLDAPPITFKDADLLEKSCYAYFRRFNIERRLFFRAFDRALTAHREYKNALRSKSAEVMDMASREGRRVILVVDRPYHLDRYINQGVHETLTQMGIDVITGDSVPLPGETLGDVQVLTQWEYTNRLYNAGKFANDHEDLEVVQLNSFGCGLDAIATDVLTDILKESGKNLTVIRIDEISSPGSIKLRLRTLVESLKMNRRSGPRKRYERRSLPLFMKEDRHRIILVPFFSDFYSPFAESAFAESGYRFKVLPPPDKRSLEIGLKYTNNEICYPAIIVVGDILKALESGRYDLSRVAVGITQTGAQCRASNYVTLIKRGLLWAGYHIPVITVHFKGSGLHPQPGFRLNRVNLIKTGLYSLTFADALSLMYHPILVREKRRGSAWELVRKYFDLWHMDDEKSEDKVL